MKTPANQSDSETLDQAADETISGLIGYALRRAQLRVFDDFFSTVSGEGITPARFSALMVVSANPGISQQALAQSLNIARSGVVMLVDWLEEAGLVSREALEEDRRAVALHLTRKGRDRLKRIVQLVDAHESRVCSQLSAKEKETLLELLSRVG
jgi:DNA-binding MarR family transcriptional regulator